MSKSNGLTAEQMIEAIEKSQGFVSKAAELLGVGRTSFYTYLKKYSTAQQALKDVREKRHDFVELQLLNNIKKGKETSIIFYLKTQCKNRGYIERVEHSGPDGQPIETIEVVKDYGNDTE